MGWPQYTYIVITVFGLGLVAAKDGEPRKGKHDFMTTALSTGFAVWLLYKGGFFA